MRSGGWNFGEVILQAINAQQERSARAAMQERALKFEDAESRRRHQEALELETKRQGHQERVQALQESGAMDRVRESGKQQLAAIAAQSKSQEHQLLLSQEPVDAAQLEAQYKGTAVSGMFSAAANKDGKVTLHDRQLIMGMLQADKELGQRASQFSEQMKFMGDQAQRDHDLFMAAQAHANDKAYSPVPDKRYSPGMSGKGLLAFGLAGGAVGVGAVTGGAPSGAGPALLPVWEWARSTAGETEWSKKKRAEAEAANAEAGRQRTSYLDEVEAILDRNKRLPLTPATTSAVELGAPILAPAAAYDPLSPVVPRARGFLQYGRGPLLPQIMRQQSALELDAQRNEADYQRALLKQE